MRDVMSAKLGQYLTCVIFRDHIAIKVFHAICLWQLYRGLLNLPERFLLLSIHVMVGMEELIVSLDLQSLASFSQLLSKRGS